MHNIVITKMGIEHIDGVMIVENLSFSIPWSKDAFVQEVTTNQFAIYITAIMEGNVVGYAGMWKVYDEGHVTNVAVHPEYRRNGIGSILVESLLDIAVREKISSMTLEVRRSNISAQDLYKKYGFEPVGIRKGYYADNGEDAIIMWKYDVEI